MGVQEMIGDVHLFKCGQCKKATPNVLIKTYECADIPEAPGEVWLIECQRCFTQRIIYPTERITTGEDDITRCKDCGNWIQKSDRCRVCRLARGQEMLKIKYFTGHTEIVKDVDIADL
jgi:NAD-dependent SIR2 family protein deacetylase